MKLFARRSRTVVLSAALSTTEVDRLLTGTEARLAQARADHEMAMAQPHGIACISTRYPCAK